MLELEPYSSNLQETWDRFAAHSNNGTIFHTRKFLNYHPSDRFSDHSLVFKNNGKIVALFPAALSADGEDALLVSHPGASFGGFVVREEINLRLSFDLVETLIEYSRLHDFAGIDLTLPPIFYSRKIENYLDFALFKNRFSYRKREISSFVTLDFSPDDVLPAFKPEARTAVRRAKKLNIVVKKSTDFAAFYRILKRNLKMRHNVTPTHSQAELEQLHDIFPETVQLYGAFLQNQMIAGVVMFHCNPLVTLAFYISHNEDFQEYRPVNLLFYEIFRESIQQDFRYLDFGIFTVDMEPNWGLARFKENFGSKGIFRDSFRRMFT